MIMRLCIVKSHVSPVNKITSKTMWYIVIKLQNVASAVSWEKI